MRHLPWLIIGAVWGVVAVILTDLGGTTPNDCMRALAQSEHVRLLTVELLTNDSVGLILGIAFVPAFIGIDVLSWTVGLVACVAMDGVWPGSALGALFAPHPTLSWILVVVFSILSGAGLMLPLGALLRFAAAKARV